MPAAAVAAEEGAIAPSGGEMDRLAARAAEIALFPNFMDATGAAIDQPRENQIQLIITLRRVNASGGPRHLG